MNPEIFVHAQLKNFTGERPSKSESSSAESQPSRRDSKPAVIRPVRHLGLGSDTVRAEAAQTIPEPHLAPESAATLSSTELEAFVQRLRQQAREQTSVQSAQTTPAQLVVSSKRSEISPPVQPTAPTPTASMPTAELSLENFLRMDHGHSSIAPPVSPVSDFSVEQEIARIQEKLARYNGRKQKSPLSTGSLEPLVEPPLQSVETESRSFVDIETDVFARIDAAQQQANGPTKPREISSENFPNTRAANQTEREPFSQTNSQTSNNIKPETNDVIRSIAEAIASVLTQQAPADIEQKLLSELDPKIASAIPDQDAQRILTNIAQTIDDLENEARVAQPTIGNAATTSAGAATGFATAPMTSQSVQPQSSQTADLNTQPDPLTDLAGGLAERNRPATDQPEPQFHSTPASGLEIPTTIAAWDVEDFRWPAVTNHMIVAGHEAVGQLAESVFETLGPVGCRLVVTSPGRGEGTTSVAISLARWAAASGKRVLLVDADLASPGLSQQVGLESNLSWVNAIQTELDPAEVIIRSQHSPVCIMPLAPIVTRVSWPRFMYDQLGELTNRVRSSFDVMIFDVGPASQLIAELSRVSMMVDSGLIVHNGTMSPEFTKTKERLAAFGIQKTVIAQNSVRQIKSNVA